MASGERGNEASKVFLSITGVSVIGTVIGCVIWAGEPCLAGMIGGMVPMVTLVPGLILFLIEKLVLRAE
jgi:hypothetical protein